MATIYQADLKPPFLLPLDPDFKQATKYYFGGQYDAKKFAEFVEYYGTHYVTRAAFGGKGEMKTAVSKSFAEAHQTNDLNIQASAHFSFLAAKLDVNHHSDQASTAWTSTSTVTSQLYGGTIGGSLDNWEKWYPTFWKNPVKITYKLTSYSEIIKDQQEISFAKTNAASLERLAQVGVPAVELECRVIANTTALTCSAAQMVTPAVSWVAVLEACGVATFLIAVDNSIVSA